MLWSIAIILALLWALGLVTSYTLGGYVHILIVDGGCVGSLFGSSKAEAGRAND